MEKSIIKEAVPEREFQIPVQLSNLRDVAIELNTAVDELMEKLAPVCNDFAVDSKSPRDPETPLVPLAYEINVCYNSILNSHLKITKILDNLEL